MRRLVTFGLNFQVTRLQLECVVEMALDVSFVDFSSQDLFLVHNILMQVQ